VEELEVKDNKMMQSGESTSAGTMLILKLRLIQGGALLKDFHHAIDNLAQFLVLNLVLLGDHSKLLVLAPKVWNTIKPPAESLRREHVTHYDLRERKDDVRTLMREVVSLVGRFFELILVAHWRK